MADREGERGGWDDVRSFTRGCTRDWTTLKEPVWALAAAAGLSDDCGMYIRIGTCRRSRELLSRTELTLLNEA